MAEAVTISFVGDTEIEAALKAWAEEDDRSVSAVIRRIILAERNRRSQLPLAGLETQDVTTEEAPAAQMKANGCPPLVEA